VLSGEGRIALVLEERVDREMVWSRRTSCGLHYGIKFGCGDEIVEKALLDLLGRRCKREKRSKTETAPCYEGPRRCTNPLVSAYAHADGRGFQLSRRRASREGRGVSFFENLGCDRLGMVGWLGALRCELDREVCSKVGLRVMHHQAAARAP
jgi:hypothetical protein